MQLQRVNSWGVSTVGAVLPRFVNWRLCKFYSDTVVGVEHHMLARCEVDEVAPAVIEAVVVKVVCDLSRRRLCDHAVHTEGLFVAADLYVGVCVK